MLNSADGSTSVPVSRCLSRERISSGNKRETKDVIRWTENPARSSASAKAVLSG